MSEELLTGGEPEYLEQGSGTPMPRHSKPRRPARAFVFAGVGLVGLGLAGVGTWAALALYGGGPQPAEALPASTLAYLSVDLDPSAGQKLEAVKMLKKFPAISDELHLGSKADLRRAVFDALQEDSNCADLDYDTDIAPWLGDRAAAGAVDLGGKTPDPVVALQITDEDKAEKGLAAIDSCEGGRGSTRNDVGYVVADGWAIVSSSEDNAQKIVDEAAHSSLADDPTYQKWLGRIGDPGIVTAYAAPALGQTLLDTLEQPGGPFSLVSPGSAAMGSVGASAPLAREESAVPAELRDALMDFAGAAGTLRFADGAFELESAGQLGGQDSTSGAGDARDLVGSLPSDTAAAVGLGLRPGWAQALLDQMDSGSSVGGWSVDGSVRQLEKETGLKLPEDLENLLGDAFAVAVGPDIDPAAVGASDGSDLPVGVKIHGDPAQVQPVLEKLSAALGMPEASNLLQSASGDGVVAVSPDKDYRSALAEDGGLGDTARFHDVVRTGEGAEPANLVLYVDFDAGDGWLARSVDDREVRENVEPLSALGLSTWSQDGVTHSLLRVTTD